MATPKKIMPYKWGVLKLYIWNILSLISGPPQTAMINDETETWTRWRLEILKKITILQRILK